MKWKQQKQYEESMTLTADSEKINKTVRPSALLGKRKKDMTQIN